jgi:hypothetical protein
LNDLQEGECDEVILMHIKNSVSNEEYLEIKSNLNKLDSLEEIKLENYKLKTNLEDKLNVIKELEDKNKIILNLNQELEYHKEQLLLVRRKLVSSPCYKIRSFFKFKEN